MSQFYAFTTHEIVDEWGSLTIEVRLIDVVLFAFDTGNPVPADRSRRQGLHDSAVTQCANRLRRAISG